MRTLTAPENVSDEMWEAVKQVATDMWELSPNDIVQLQVATAALLARAKMEETA